MFDCPTSYTQIFAGFSRQSTPDSSGTIRRRYTGVRSSVMPNAKRIYDEVKNKIKKTNKHLIKKKLYLRH